MKMRSSEKGSSTLEAAIIFPLVLFCIVGVIYAPIILYRKTGTQILTDYSTRRAAKVWDNINKDLNSGKLLKTADGEDFQEVPLYWNIYDKNKSIKEQNIDKWLTLEFRRYPLLYDQDMIVNIDTKDYFIFKKLKSQVISSSKIPINANKIMFIEINTDSNIIINDPILFIRDMDFFYDVIREVGEKDQNSGVFIDKIIKIIADTKKSIKKFGDL